MPVKHFNSSTDYKWFKHQNILHAIPLMNQVSAIDLLRCLISDRNKYFTLHFFNDDLINKIRPITCPTVLRNVSPLFSSSGRLCSTTYFLKALNGFRVTYFLKALNGVSPSTKTITPLRSLRWYPRHEHRTSQRLVTKPSRPDFLDTQEVQPPISSRDLSH